MCECGFICCQQCTSHAETSIDGIICPKCRGTCKEFKPVNRNVLSMTLEKVVFKHACKENSEKSQDSEQE